MAANNHNISDVAEGTLIGTVTSFVLNELMPWTIHTIAAIASGAIVAVCVFFVNRWLRKKFGEK